ncbi:MAG: hypothetical protein KQH57_12485 [Actinomycetales bacterium]|nr:hypothetical protein [Actinomycetales bacterium]
MRSAAHVAVPALALAATLALAGCGGRPADPASMSAPATASAATGTGQSTATGAPAATTATTPAGPVVDQDTLDAITGVLDDTERVLDAVDQEIAADPQE